MTTSSGSLSSTADSPLSSSFSPFNSSMTEHLMCSGSDVRRVIVASSTKSCTLDPIPAFSLKESLDPLLSYLMAMISASVRHNTRNRHSAAQETVSTLVTVAEQVVVERTNCYHVCNRNISITTPREHIVLSDIYAAIDRQKVTLLGLYYTVSQKMHQL